MSLVLVCSIVVCLAALVWSVVLLVRLRDGWLAFIGLMLAAMLAGEVASAIEQQPGWPPRLRVDAGELLGLAVSLMALFVVSLLGRVITNRKRSEVELRRKTTTIESAVTPIAFSSAEGLITYVNPAFVAAWGYDSPEEIVGRHNLDFSADPNLVQGLMDAVFADGHWRGEDLARRKDGSTFPIELSVVRAAGVNGQAPGFMATFIDITARRRVEAAEQEFGTVIEDSVNEVYIFDADTLRFLRVNRGARENLGYSEDEMSEMTPIDLKPDFTREAFESVIEPLRASDREAVLFSTRHRRKDGTVYPVAVHLHSSTWRGKAAFVAIILDVTERQEATEFIREKQARLEAMLATAVDGIITIDARGIVESFNPAAERLFGYTADEVEGRNISMLMPAPYHAEHDGYLKRYHETGERRIIGIGREVEGRRKDGTHFPIDLSVSEFQARDGVRFTGIIRDLTEKREAEEQIRRSERLLSIGTLAAGLGHDMHNVLLPVRARLDILESDHDEVVNGHLMHVRRSINYLQSLADGLHLLSLDPDEMDASSETTDVTHWWSQVQPLLSRSLPKDVEFTVSIDPPPAPLLVAPHRLTQAMLNLLVNAANAVGENGHVRLDSVFDATDHTFRMTVTDDGCGMSPEVQSRALDPFFTTKKRGLGTGLGLTLVHGVAQSAGGQVGIESTPGRGSAIALTIPCAEIADADSADGSRSVALVTIEEERLASMVGHILEQAGFAPSFDRDEFDRSQVWVMEPATEDARVVRKFLRHPGCEVIAVGPAGGQWDGFDMHRVDPPDFLELRRVIGEVSVKLREGA